MEKEFELQEKKRVETETRKLLAETETKLIAEEKEFLTLSAEVYRNLEESLKHVETRKLQLEGLTNFLKELNSRHEQMDKLNIEIMQLAKKKLEEL
jgi:hypothetical protein